MTLARPWLLLLLLLPVAWWWLQRRREPGGTRFSDLSLVAMVRERRWLAQVPRWCRGLAFTAWILAAAGPRVGGAQVEMRKEGIAIVIAVDISSSMLAEDFAPSNRMEVAKSQAIAFIRGRSADRIGVVAFAGEALTQVPITVDYPVLEQSVGNLRIGMLEDGTAIGTGLATAVNRLREAPGKSKVVLLLTDGENNRGAIDPLTAADLARALGVKVYSILVGRPSLERVTVDDPVMGRVQTMMNVGVDERPLVEIARRTGGRFFRAGDASTLSGVYSEIDRLERAPIRALVYREYRDLGPLLLGLAAIVLAFYSLSLSTWAFRAP